LQYGAPLLSRYASFCLLTISRHIHIEKKINFLPEMEMIENDFLLREGSHLFNETGFYLNGLCFPDFYWFSIYGKFFFWWVEIVCWFNSRLNISCEFLWIFSLKLFDWILTDFRNLNCASFQITYVKFKF